MLRWFTDAAAANGRDIEERSGEGRVRRKAEENSLAVQLQVSLYVWVAYEGDQGLYSTVSVVGGVVVITKLCGTSCDRREVKGYL